MIIPILSVLAVVAAIVGVFAGRWWAARHFQNMGLSAQDQARKILDDASHESESLVQKALIESKEYLLKAKEEIEKENSESQNKNREREKRLVRREQKIEQLEEELKAKQKDSARREQELARKEEIAEVSVQNATNQLQEIRNELERVAGLSTEEARKILEEKVVDEAKLAAVDRIAAVEQETQSKVDSIVKKILVTAMQRYASEYVAERTVSVVQLPNDDMKGRIIGREGRNIRVFEAATGVDLIIDDTPEAVILSCFNPLRREVGKVALTKLIADGRIHPTRIEDLVQKSEEEVAGQCRRVGEQVAFDLGLQKLHPELSFLLGSLKFRSSYAQNLLLHSIEVGHIAGMIAAELGVGAKYARRAGVLHDIGKAVDHHEEGSHAEVGAALAKKYGENARIVQAIASHHNEVEPQSLLDHVIQIANQLSAQRPGARKEFLASYIKRLEDLEKLCTMFPDVKKAYALQAGREIRVMVENQRISDAGALLLAREIAAKIENNLAYPGQIKVNIIRETRAVEYAK